MTSEEQRLLRNIVLQQPVSGDCFMLGSGTVWAKMLFVLPRGMYRFAAVSTARSHSIGLLTSGQVVAWGNNKYGQLQAPILPSHMRYTNVYASDDVSAGLLDNGTVLLWGLCSTFQIDSVPKAVVQLHVPNRRITTICFGGSQSNAFVLCLLDDGTIIGYGYNRGGQCDAPAAPHGQTYVAISAGGSFSGALLDTGQVVCWGRRGRIPPYPKCPAGLRAVGVAAHNKSLVVVLSNGRLKQWGAQRKGGKGPLPKLPRGRDTRVVSLGISSVAVAALSSGKVLAWGPVGGESAVRHVTADAPMGRRFVSVAAGDTYALALLDNGCLLSWGQSYDYANNRNNVSELTLFCAILETTLAMLPLDLPAYVLLWILDYVYPQYSRVLRESVRVNLIQSIRNSRQKIERSRSSLPAEKRARLEMLSASPK
jgi:alpha-tubulin suppressor-like RCC1 family protein